MVALKAPQGVYVNEVTHPTTARLVENALDGAGTLGGFIDYLETTLHQLGQEATDLDHQGDSEREAIKALGEAPKDGFQRTGGISFAMQLLPTEAFETYKTAWQEAAKHLPWGEDDARSHAFALYFHRDSRWLWERDATPAPRRSPYRNVGLNTYLKRLKREGHDGRIHLPSTDAALEPLPSEKPFPTVWRKGLEIILDEPKARSTSFYLDPAAHEFTINLFGRSLFDRAERGLQRLLANQAHWLSLEAEFSFLEHGPALLEYQQAPLDPKDLSKALQEVPPHRHYPKEELLAPSAYPLPLSYFTWNTTTEPLRVREHTWALAQTLELAFRLGLLPAEDDSWREQLLPAFMNRFHLDRLGPERTLAYQIIKGIEVIDALSNGAFTDNAVDYHLQRLFQLYALTVLPSSEREPERVHPFTLATLSQPWVFPTKTTLEAYSGLTASKDANGTWILKRGKNQLELSNREAYWTARTLNTVFTTQPARTRTQRLILEEENAVLDDVTVSYYDSDHDPFAPSPLDWPLLWANTLRRLKGTGAPSRVTLPLGAATIKRARELVDTKQPDAKIDPIGAGLTLIAELTDDAIHAEGHFVNDFLRRTGPWAKPELTPRQELALKKVVNLAYGHTPDNFHRATTPEGNGLWAYYHDGAEHFLAQDFHASMGKLATAHTNHNDTEPGILNMAGAWDIVTMFTGDEPDYATVLQHLRDEGLDIDNPLFLEAARLYAEVAWGQGK